MLASLQPGRPRIYQQWLVRHPREAYPQNHRLSLHVRPIEAIADENAHWRRIALHHMVKALSILLIFAF